jgi:hypothetical protein
MINGGCAFDGKVVTLTMWKSLITINPNTGSLSRVRLQQLLCVLA